MSKQALMVVMNMQGNLECIAYRNDNRDRKVYPVGSASAERLTRLAKRNDMQVIVNMYTVMICVHIERKRR